MQCKYHTSIPTLLVYLVALPCWTHGASLPRSENAIPHRQSQPQNSLRHGVESSTLQKPKELRNLLSAISTMQDTYFDIFTGTWPDAIDWTSAVMGTQISATLSSMVSSFGPPTSSSSCLSSSSLLAASESCSDLLEWQNVVDRYFAQTSVFYFGENAFGLRNQAFDDMLWVVLGWIENIKFAEMYALKHWDLASTMASGQSGGGWHGLQFSPMAAHRARIFYELASTGWDEDLCGGGMNWNPRLTPYKNAITNELYTSASIAMYLYYPGDNNSSPYMASSGRPWSGLEKPHDPSHLENAIQNYKWLKESHMQSSISGLYQDGFHINGWERYRNGTINPGTGNCDELNTMVFTYNQGVLLSASRGLWMATGARSYLEDGHALVSSVIRATGWPNKDSNDWKGLGRGGVLEDYCDHSAGCSQDGQTFKGIFMHHFSEFCRPLWPHEEEMIEALLVKQSQQGESMEEKTTKLDRDVYKWHLELCDAYGKWVEHNADAALATRDRDGLFGMWWTHEKDDAELEAIKRNTKLPEGAVDYVNSPVLPVPHYPNVRQLDEGLEEWAMRRYREEYDDVEEEDSVDAADAANARQRVWEEASSSKKRPQSRITDEDGRDKGRDPNKRGRGRTVETQSGGLAVLRAAWNWKVWFL